MALLLQCFSWQWTTGHSCFSPHRALNFISREDLQNTLGEMKSMFILNFGCGQYDTFFVSVTSEMGSFSNMMLIIHFTNPACFHHSFLYIFCTKWFINLTFISKSGDKRICLIHIRKQNFSLAYFYSFNWLICKWSIVIFLAVTYIIKSIILVDA